MALAPALRAQAQGAVGTDAVPESSVRPPILSAPATPVDLRRYTLVGQCESAVTRERWHTQLAMVRRYQGRVPDSVTLRLGYERGLHEDTAVVAAARRCLHSLSRTQVPSREFMSWLALAVAAHDDPLVDTVVAWQLAAVATASDRAHAVALLRAMNIMVDGSSKRWDLYRRYAAELDRRWPGAIPARVTVIATLMGHAQGSGTDTTLIDPAPVKAGIARVRALMAEKPSEPLMPEDEIQMRVITGIMRGTEMQMTMFEPGHVPGEVAAEMAKLSSDPMLSQFRGYGDTLPAVTGELWLRSDGVTLPDSARRARTPGRPAMVVPDWCDGKNSDCVRQYDALGWLERKFPALDVTIVRTTRGLTRAGELASVPEEVADWRRYLFDTLGLRGTLVVDTAPHVKTPPPHNHWIWMQSPMQTRFVEPFGYLLDPEGRIVWHGMLLRDDRLLVTLLHKLTQQASPPAAAARSNGTPSP